MDPETVESTAPPASTSAAETTSQTDANLSSPTQAQRDAWALVEQLIEAGEWPEPELLEQIVAAGDAATGPLVSILEARPRGWPAESILDPVIGLLTMLGPPEAVPALVELVKSYTNETAESAADALVDFGTPGFEALVELCNDPSIRGYARNVVFEAAVYAAGDDPAQQSRLAGVLRPILEERIVRAREELRQKGWLAKLPPRDEFLDEDEDDFEFDGQYFEDENEYEDDEEDEGEEIRLFDYVNDEAIDQDFQEEDDVVAVSTAFPQPAIASAGDTQADEANETNEGNDPEIAEELAYVVGALADLADPFAREAIMTAFAEGLVDEAIVDQDQVTDSYRRLADRDDSTDAADWLSSYREDYAAHVEAMAPPARPAPRIYVPPPPYQFEDLEPVPGAPVIAPIRNAGPKLGRNDPCWCGSGQKYKNCHLGHDTLVEPD
jgi:hypothetical protein